MTDYKSIIAKQIFDHIGEGSGLDLEDIYNNIAYPKDLDMADFAFPCFRLAKALKKSPAQIAQDLQISMKDGLAPEIKGAEAVSGFLNFFMDPVHVAQDTVAAVLSGQDEFGASGPRCERPVIVEYSSANVAKPLHIGHVRTTMIGESLKRIYKFCGYKVVAVNHIGDYGTQFGKLIVATKNWGDMAKIEADPIKQLLRLYVKFHDEAKDNPALEDDARAWFTKLENGDDEARRMWEFFVKVSLSEFDRIYKKLGVTFDSYNGESFYSDKMAPILKDLREKGLAQKSKGAEIVDLEDVGLVPALVTKSDGSTLYLTRDLAAAKYRKDHYNFLKNIYVVGSEQRLHFKQIFAVLKKLGYDWADDCHHIANGMVDLETGKMSTRAGNTVFLEDVLEESAREILRVIDEKNPSLPDKEKVAQQVGYGAVIFQELYTSREKDYTFSIDKVTSFQGETGPYVQYTHARCCSLLARDKEGFEMSMLQPDPAADLSLLSDEYSQSFLKRVRRFSEMVHLAMINNEPHTVARFAVDIAQSFNRFYQENPIHSDDADLTRARLELVKIAEIVIRNALRLVCLEAPVQM